MASRPPAQHDGIVRCGDWQGPVGLATCNSATCNPKPALRQACLPRAGLKRQAGSGSGRLATCNSATCILQPETGPSAGLPAACGPKGAGRLRDRSACNMQPGKPETNKPTNWQLVTGNRQPTNWQPATGNPFTPYPAPSLSALPQRHWDFWKIGFSRDLR